MSKHSAGGPLVSIGRPPDSRARHTRSSLRSATEPISGPGPKLDWQVVWTAQWICLALLMGFKSIRPSKACAVLLRHHRELLHEARRCARRRAGRCRRRPYSGHTLRVTVLKSTTTSTENHEDWLNSKVDEGMGNGAPAPMVCVNRRVHPLLLASVRWQPFLRALRLVSRRANGAFSYPKRTTASVLPWRYHGADAPPLGRTDNDKLTAMHGCMDLSPYNGKAAYCYTIQRAATIDAFRQ